MAALPLEEIVVAASRSIGIFVADAGPSDVHRAAASLRVEEHADASEDAVLLVAQHLLTIDYFGESRFGRLEIDAEVPGQTIEVALSDNDPIVAATVGRALAAVVERFR